MSEENLPENDVLEFASSLENFANSLGSGFLKPWKSNSIASTLMLQIPEICRDKERLYNYMQNCLGGYGGIFGNSYR